MSKAPSSTSQDSRKDDYAKNESILRHFDMDKAFGPRIGKTREERVQYGEATGQRVPDIIKEWLKRGQCSVEGWWCETE